MKKKIKYIFDVDGTLTPSRGKMNEDFRLWFTNFCGREEVYLVTGSDYSKTREQIGGYLMAWPKRIYNCSGSDVWQGEKRIRTSEWSLPDDLRSNMEMWIAKSKFEYKTGNHIEDRPGSVNFSIVGRNAKYNERQKYIEWDNKTGERQALAKKINTLYPHLSASVGGETGLDIYPQGKDKSQILEDFQEDDVIYFFGDKMEEGGNDYPLAKELNNESKVFPVKNWKETFEILKGFDY